MRRAEEKHVEAEERVEVGTASPAPCGLSLPRTLTVQGPGRALT